MEHQDWQTITFTKKKKDLPKEAVVKSSVINTTVTSSEKPAWKVEKQIDSDVGKPLTYVSSEVAKQIIGGRIAAKLSQKQLAQKLNLQEKDIKEIESCKAVENKALIAKIRRLLNIM